jgi:hypothetical protein
MSPKAFISYSWTSECHREMVRNWADQLITDGVEVLLDQYDLKEGQDKNSFMERMVTDPTVTHILMICDKAYAEKADARKAGVGTESQIISQEVYAKVDQSKFIPVVCEFLPDGEPYVPTFVKSRIWLNFSSPELANNNWEQLVRLLFGKPLLQKPSLGKPPAYVLQDSKAPANPAASRFVTFKQALLQGRTGIALYRADFLDACFEYADTFRIRILPTEENFAQKVLEDCEALLPIRNLIIDWIILEASFPHSQEFDDALNQTLERLLELRSRPPELASYYENWFEAQRLFTYQVFLYVIAALVRTQKYKALHELFFSNYLLPIANAPEGRFDSFGAFYSYSELLSSVLAPKGQRLLSPAGALLKRQATREDLSFELVMEADLLALLASALNPKARWFPQTLYYAGYGKAFPLFIRATQHKHFQKFAEITGIKTADELRTKAKEGFERLSVNTWNDFRLYSNVSFWSAMNMDKLDTLK